MKFKIIALSALSALLMSACSTTSPLPETTVGVIEEVKDIKASPETKNNRAKLIKLGHQCVIEFNAVMESGHVRENWTFSGNTLISANSVMVAKDGSSAAKSFDLYDANVQANFLSLRDNFKKEYVEACQ